MRYPKGTPYVGPTACYDEQIEPEQLLRRLVYGRAKPLLGPYDRMDARFFGKLIDGLANAHAVIVKSTKGAQHAHNVGSMLRQELPAEHYHVAVLEAPERGDWLVIAYNQVTWDMRKPPAYKQEGVPIGESVWVSTPDAARVLGLSTRRVRSLVAESGVPQRREGGSSKLLIRQCDLVVLANRDRRWKKKRTAA